MAVRPDSGDDMFRELTLSIARGTRLVHPPVGGQCEQCREPSPCSALIRADRARWLLVETERVVGVAPLNPSWLAGVPAGRHSGR